MAKHGLTVETFQGLNKKRFDSQGSYVGKRMIFDKNAPTNTVQFLQPVDDFIEFDRHVFREDGRWTFVPHIKADCPLCDSEDEAVRRKTYTFACNVWNLPQGKVQVLEGPRTLASLIRYRYDRKPTAFLKRVYDITRFPTSPVSYNFELAEETPVSTTGKKAYDLEEYVEEELKRYYGDDLEAALADLRADEDEEDEEEDEDEEEEDWEDEDEEDEDEEDEEDEDEEEDEEEEEPEPAPRARRSTTATKSRRATKKTSRPTTKRR